MAATQPMFKTAYNYPEGKFCPTGDGIVKEYEHRINDKGQKSWKKPAKQTSMK